LHGPFFVLLQQQGANEPDDSSFVWEDAGDLTASFDLSVEALQ
jgi:hypothetical protein